jgi:hypothetical protein
MFFLGMKHGRVMLAARHVSVIEVFCDCVYQICSEMSFVYPCYRYLLRPDQANLIEV